MTIREKIDKFRTLLRASMKSEDTEEWLDVHFTRPIGLAFALFWHRFGVTPNSIPWCGGRSDVLFHRHII